MVGDILVVWVLFLSWRAGGQHGSCPGTWPPSRKVGGGFGDWQAGEVAAGVVLALQAVPETLPTAEGAQGEQTDSDNLKQIHN